MNCLERTLINLYNNLSTIGRFTVTSHAKTCAHLLRLVGKTVKLAAIFAVLSFNIVQIYNYGSVVCCCGVDSSLFFHHIP